MFNFTRNMSLLAVFMLLSGLLLCYSFRPQPAEGGFTLEHEQEISKEEAGTHNGGGSTTGFSFFQSVKNSKLVFRKRVLHPGSAIGYHLQKEEEIYYVVSGEGQMKMNDSLFSVRAGDAILTYPGSSHSLQQTGNQDLVVIINYQKQKGEN